VLVGVPDLTWDLVDDATTPTLSRMAAAGSSAALVPRGTHEVTCPADAWLTLGAGQRAATDLAGCVDGEADSEAGGETGDETGDETGPADRATPADVVGADAVDPARWHDWQEAAERRALGPQLGSLARLLEDAGTCVASYGPGAAIAAADPTGGLTDASADGLAAAAEGLAPGCRVHLVEAPGPVDGSGSGTAPGDSPSAPEGDAPAQDGPAGLSATDEQLGALLAAVPPGTRVVVAGLGSTTGTAGATVLVSVRTGDDGGPASLTSDSTRQTGLVQLPDLTAALLDAAGAEADGAVAGGLVRQVDATDPPRLAAGLADAVSSAKRVAPWALGGLAALVLPVLLAAALLRRPRAVAVVATLAMAVPVATFLAGLVPWWSAGRPLPVLVATVLGAAALVAGLAWAGPWRTAALGPPALVAAVTLAVLGADVLTSSRLGLVSVLGLQPVTAGRFFGQGNVGFGIMLGAFLVLSAALLGVSGTTTALAVGVLGVATLLVNAAPGAGADFGGVPATVLATGLLVLTALGLRWRPGPLALLAGAGVLVAAAVMLADWARGAERRTHLGDFVQSTLDGEAAAIVARKLAQSLGILVSYPLSWLAVLALVLVTAVAVARAPAWTAPLWREPGLRPALLAGAVAMAATWALNDSGIAAVALTLALLIATAIVVLARGMPVVRSRPGRAPSPSTPSPP
jgi:hypothetical protein